MLLRTFAVVSVLVRINLPEHPSMTTEIARENMTYRLVRPIPPDNSSTETFIRLRELIHIDSEQTSSATFVVEPDPSVFSVEINQWMTGDNPAIVDSAIQSRVATTQRSTIVTSSSLIGGGLWYAMAMILPLLSSGNGFHWRCTPSVLLRTGEVLFSKLAAICGRARTQVQSLARDQIVREIFATALDIVLVIYAIGFLILSMCQATVVGR